MEKMFKMLVAKLFGTVEKEIIKQYCTCEFGQHSTEIFIL